MALRAIQLLLELYRRRRGDVLYGMLDAIVKFMICSDSFSAVNLVVLFLNVILTVSYCLINICHSSHDLSVRFVFTGLFS